MAGPTLLASVLDSAETHKDSLGSFPPRAFARTAPAALNRSPSMPLPKRPSKEQVKRRPRPKAGDASPVVQLDLRAPLEEPKCPVSPVAAAAQVLLLSALEGLADGVGEIAEVKKGVAREAPAHVCAQEFAENSRTELAE